MHKFSWILVFYILFFLWILNSFAFEADLQIDKKETDINDYINLRVGVKSDDKSQIWITDIKWIENFDIINQSQSQSSSTNVQIINWNAETKVETQLNLDITLKARNKWEYVLWPAILSDWSGELSTNTVQIKITWDDLFVNNNHLNINPQTNQWNTNQNPNSNNWNIWNTNTQNNTAWNVITENKADSIQDYEDTQKRNFDSDKSLYLLLAVLFTISVLTYTTIKKNPEFIEKLMSKSENDTSNDTQNTSHNINYSSEKTLEQKTNFAEKILEKETIIPKNTQKLPDLSDPNFLANIDKYFRQNISNKYKISNIDNKTYDEILSGLEIENTDKIEEIIKLLNKAKYSNSFWDNEKILEILKELN